MNKYNKIEKSTHLLIMKHPSSPTPFLHPAGSPILTSTFSLLKLKTLKLMEIKMPDLLLGQEAVKTKGFFNF